MLSKIRTVHSFMKSVTHEEEYGRFQVDAENQTVSAATTRVNAANANRSDGKLVVAVLLSLSETDCESLILMVS